MTKKYIILRPKHIIIISCKDTASLCSLRAGWSLLLMLLSLLLPLLLLPLLMLLLHLLLLGLSAGLCLTQDGIGRLPLGAPACMCCLG